MSAGGKVTALLDWFRDRREARAYRRIHTHRLDAASVAHLKRRMTAGDLPQSYSRTVVSPSTYDYLMSDEAAPSEEERARQRAFEARYGFRRDQP